MRKFNTILIMLLLIVTAASAKTDKYASSFGTPSSNATYSGTTFSWTAGNSNSMKVLGNLKGNVDLSKYKFLHVKISDKAEGTSGFRVLIYCDNNGSTTSYIGEYYSSTEIDLDLTNITLETSGHTYANINNIHIAGLGNSGSFTVTPADVYLATEDYECMSLSSPVTGFSWRTYSDGSDWGTTGLTRNLGNSLGQNQIIYGPTQANATTAYIDATNYDNAVFTLSEAGTFGIRLMYNSDITIIDTKAGQTEYVQSLASCPKIANIKTKNNSGLSNITVSSIDFVKDFKAASQDWSFLYDVNGTSVNYDRTFTPGRKSTVCLPFALTAAEATAAGTFYELASIVDGTLHFNEVAEPQAYVPYVFNPATDQPFVNLTNKTIEASKDATTEVTGATFVGTLAHIDGLNGGTNTLYGFNAANGEFVKVGTGVSIDAFRAYISVPGTGAAKLAAHFGDETSGITSYENDNQNKNRNAYNLAGQRVDANAKGIVIINGKKYINK